MDISVRTETRQVEDRSWLGSAHGTEATESITLDVSAFTEADHFPDGYIPSGIALGKITASGKYGPYNNDVDPADGTETLVGHLFSATKVNPDALTVDVGAALLTHGKVVIANLPDNHGVDAAGAVEVKGSIRYIGTVPA